MTAPTLWWKHVGYGGNRTMWECEIVDASQLELYYSREKSKVWVRLIWNPGSVRLVNKENLVVVNG